MEPGHLCLVDYGERPPCWHSRLLLAQVEGSVWVCLPPDHDRYEEQMDHLNPDFTGFEYLGESAVVPAHIRGAAVYGFAPLDPAFLAGQVRQAKVEANAMRAARGLPPLCGR